MGHGKHRCNGLQFIYFNGISSPINDCHWNTNCVFLMTKFHQEIKEHGNKVKALSRVIQKIGTATFLTNLSTALGFLTFAFTNSEKLVRFGIAASANIMLVFIISICILPIFASFSKR